MKGRCGLTASFLHRKLAKLGKGKECDTIKMLSCRRLARKRLRAIGHSPVLIRGRTLFLCSTDGTPFDRPLRVYPACSGCVSRKGGSSAARYGRSSRVPGVAGLALTDVSASDRIP